MDEKRKKKIHKKSREQRHRSVCDDEEQPGPSSQLTPGQRKMSKKTCFFSPLKNEVKRGQHAKSHLPVTCGDLKGTLHKEKYYRGEKCILYTDKQWFTPVEFEKRAGKESSKNWKRSIQCDGVTLGKLIQEGYLKSFRRASKRAEKSVFPDDCVNPDEEEDNDEETEHQQEANNDKSKKVFQVTCGALAGTLHKHRFASGTSGKSIRTETRWMTPVEFVKKVSCKRNASWKNDIKCEGKPLSVLIEENILSIHQHCNCNLCKPKQKDLDNQKNDDECCVCKKMEGLDLVMCDHCPRSFHQNCHLPHVEDAILGKSQAWMCTFCVFRTIQEWSYSDELEIQAALSQQISQHMLECQYLLLNLCSADEEQTFAIDPNLYLKNYSSVIQTPMCFGKVAEKLQKNKYQTVGEFVSDVQLIFTNCATYNQGNAEYLDRGRQLKELFDGEFKKVFNICEQIVD